MKLQNRKQSGFTLLELLVVVSILAIIAGAVISALDGQEETAGQGVALHTMAALENATRQHTVINDGLPNSLDALYCATVDDTTAPADSSALAGVVDFGEASNVPGSSGGLTAAYGAKMTRTAITNEGIAALNNAGIDSIRVVEATYCNTTEGETPAGTVAGETMAAEDDTLLQEADGTNMFLTPAEGEGGRSAIISLSNATTANATQLQIFDDPDDIGAGEDDYVVILGIGNGSSLVSNGFIGRAPRDGNVPGTYYGAFSLAVKIAEETGTTAGLSADDEYEGAELVAVLDSDGDFYEDEVAEFKGLEDE